MYLYHFVLKRQNRTGYISIVFEITDGKLWEVSNGVPITQIRQDVDRNKEQPKNRPGGKEATCLSIASER